MSTTHADILIGHWYRKKYYTDRGFLKPDPDSKAEHYNPFDFYNFSLDGRVADYLHHKFANLDLNDEAKIENFYSSYGPLGLFNREIAKIVTFTPNIIFTPISEKFFVAGVQRHSDDLMSTEEMSHLFHISEEKILDFKKGNFTDWDVRLTALDTWESIKDLKKECLLFRWLLDLQDAIFEDNILRIRDLFKQSDNKVYQDRSEKSDDKGILLSASNTVIWMINAELQNMVSPLLSLNGLKISKKVTWRCDSLLSSLYMMLFIDITRGVHTKRCTHKKCGKYFESSTKENKYCTEACERKARQQRYRERIENATRLYHEGKTVKDIAKEVGTEESQVVKWLEKSKEGAK